MGTNYFLEAQAPCEKCGRAFDSKHIGKSSAGWVFALHVYPDEGISDLPDWWELWNKPGSVIKDEYGKVVTAYEMLAAVVARFGARNRPMQTDFWCTQNGAEHGPYSLARARIDGHRVLGHGLGTYALYVGPEDSW